MVSQVAGPALNFNPGQRTALPGGGHHGGRSHDVRGHDVRTHDVRGHDVRRHAADDGGTTRTQSLEREQSRLSLNLKTQDGDKIQIRFGESDVQRVSVRSSDGDLQVRASERHSERFSIKVEGELDAEELEALQSVVTAAFDLAADFFAGEETDVAGLLNAAQLGGDEIAKLSLKLTQKTESIQKFSSSADGGDVNVRQVARSVDQLQARFVSLGEGLRSLISDANEGPAPQTATELARISVSAALDAALVSEPATAPGPTTGADAPANEAPAPAGEPVVIAPVASTAPVAPTEPSQPPAASAPAVVQTAVPSTTEAPAEASPEEPAVADQPVTEVADQPGEVTQDAGQAPVAAPPAAPASALDDLRTQLLAALQVANEHGGRIEFEARHIERSETSVRVRIAV